jgi:hypothetical protein
MAKEEQPSALTRLQNAMSGRFFFAARDGKKSANFFSLPQRMSDRLL